MKSDIVTNRITDILETKYPFVQAPMNWLTDANLVAAVANAGGLGIFGPNPGLTTMIHGIENHIEQMRQQIHQARKLTNKEFGINILVEDEPAIHMNGMLKVAFEENIHYFAVVGEPNQNVYHKIKEHGGIIIARPLTPTVQNAQLAEKFGADIFVATGYDEGGILPQNGQGTFTVVPMIVDAVNIPVLAAGGINDRRAVKAAMDLGATGVYVGSRLLVANEAPTASSTKEKIVNGHFSDMGLVSHDQRSLLNKPMQQLATNYQLYNDGIKNDEIISKAGGLLPGMRLGKIDTGVISTNTGIDLIKKQTSVQQIIKELMED